LPEPRLLAARWQALQIGSGITLSWLLERPTRAPGRQRPRSRRWPAAGALYTRRQGQRCL